MYYATHFVKWSHTVEGYNKMMEFPADGIFMIKKMIDLYTWA